MRFVLLVLALLPSAALADGKVICRSVDRNPGYTVAAELQTDGVFKGFYAVRIQQPEIYILAVGTAAPQDSGTLVSFFQVNENNQLRAGTSESLLINGDKSKLSLIGDTNVPLKCSAQ